MSYTISQAAEKAGLSAYTLRYYDRMGLLPFVDRSKSGIRIFEDSDLEWLEVINCLKATGMQIKEISNFLALCIEGDCTLEKRLALLREHKKSVERQMIEIQKHMKKIDHKIEYYETACRAGTERVHSKPKSKKD